MKYIKWAIGSFDELSDTLQTKVISEHKLINVKRGTKWWRGESLEVSRAYETLHDLGFRGVQLEVDYDAPKPVVEWLRVTQEPDYNILIPQLIAEEAVVEHLNVGKIKLSNGIFTIESGHSEPDKIMLGGLLRLINNTLSQVRFTLQEVLTVEHAYLTSTKAVINTLSSDEYEFYLATGELYLGGGEVC